MKKNRSLTVRIGPRGYPMEEITAGVFEHNDLPGNWRIESNHLDRYIFCSYTGRHVRFIEFTQYKGDNFTLYQGREWERRPRDDNFYTLAGPTRYHGKRMPTSFGQSVRRLIKEEQKKETAGAI